MRGCHDIIDLLLNAACEVSVADANGQTPLHSACFAGDVDSVSMLLDFGALEDARDSNVRNMTLHS